MRLSLRHMQVCFYAKVRALIMIITLRLHRDQLITSSPPKHSSYQNLSNYSSWFTRNASQGPQHVYFDNSYCFQLLLLLEALCIYVTIIVHLSIYQRLYKKYVSQFFFSICGIWSHGFFCKSELFSAHSKTNFSHKQ